MSKDKKKPYFNMSDAVDEFYGSFGATDKTVAGLKLIGKALFNTTKYTTTEIVPEVLVRGHENIVRHGDELLKNENLSPERRGK